MIRPGSLHAPSVAQQKAVYVVPSSAVEFRCGAAGTAVLFGFLLVVVVLHT